MNEHREPGNEEVALAAPSGAGLRYDPRRTLRRLRWERVRPLLFLAVLVAGFVWALDEGSWAGAIVFAFLAANRIVELRERATAADALVDDADFFEREREGVERLVLRARVVGLSFAALAATSAIVAAARTSPATRLWVVAALTGAFALVQLALRAPALARELRDLGGTPTRWRVAVGFTVLVLGSPLLVVLLVFWPLYRAVQRWRGVPADPDEDGS